jgi:tetratricopeptide (TPR) repeat protein
LDQEQVRALDVTEQLGRSYLNLGTLMVRKNKFKETVDWLGKGFALLDPQCEKGKGSEELRVIVREAHKLRATMLTQLGRQGESVSDWDRILEMDQGMTPKEDRFGRLAALTRLGDYNRAIAEAEALAVGASGGDYYDLASVYAVASAAVRKDKTLSDKEQKERAEQYADRAVELLKKSHAEGFLDGPINWGLLMSDPDLEAIRKRPAYKQFIEKARPKTDK